MVGFFHARHCCCSNSQRAISAVQCDRQHDSRFLVACETRQKSTKKGHYYPKNNMKLCTVARTQAVVTIVRCRLTCVQGPSAVTMHVTQCRTPPSPPMALHTRVQDTATVKRCTDMYNMSTHLNPLGGE